MKKILIFVSLILFVLNSCQIEKTDVEANLLTRTEKISFKRTAVVNGKQLRIAPIEGSFTFVYNEDNETIVDFDASQNINDWMGKTDDEIETILYQIVTYEDPKKPTSQTPHSDCISGCNEKFTNADGTKKDGRGWCKFNCWVDTVIRLAEALPSFKL